MAFAQDINPEAQRLVLRAIKTPGHGEKTQLLERALRLSHDFVEARLELAKTLIEIAQYRLAILHLDTTLHYDRSNANAWFNNGRAHAGLGEHQAALKDFAQAIKLRQDNPEFHLYDGQSHYALKAFERALKSFDQALSSAISTQETRAEAEAWYGKGRAHHAKGDTLMAANSYRRALRLAPDHKEAKKYLARIENQANLEIWHRAAEEAFRRRDWKKAKENYNRILFIEPSFKEVLQKLNIVKKEMKTRAQALIDSAQALRQKYMFYAAIDSLEAAKAYDEERAVAIQELIAQIEQEKIRVQNRRTAQALVDSAQALGKSHRFDEAVNLLKMAIAFDAKRAGELQELIQQMEQERTAEQNRREAQALVDSAQALWTVHRFDEAIDLLKTAITFDAKRAAELQELIRQMEQERTAEQNQRKAQILVDSTQALWKAHKFDEAIDLLKTAIIFDSARTAELQELIKHIEKEKAVAPGDFLSQSTQKNQSKRNLLVPWIATGSAAFLVMIIAFVFYQKYRTKSKSAPPVLSLLKPLDIAPPQLERYRIEHEVGRGGMSRVYKAYDLNLQRPVALKVIRLESAMDTAEIEERIQRFRREAKTTAILNHPNIVSLYDYGEMQDLVYMIMEYVEGVTIKQLVEAKEQLAIDEAIQIIKKICQALECAHRKNIIHRDIKPSNIMRDVEAKVKVVDFGIAKILASPEQQILTPSKERIGTGPYMSPEQTESEKLDGRSDIFSLGMVFYEMLAGKRPEGIRAGKPPRKLASLRSDIPASIDGVIEKMLALDREQRFKQAAEIIEALNSLADSKQ